MKFIRPARGFTLIELIVTLLMAAIILSAGVPSFRNMILNNRQTAQINNLLSSLMLARSEAVKRHNRTVVCPSVDLATCAVAAGWEQGWIVFDDPNGNDTVDPGEQVIRVYESIVNDGLTLRYNNGSNLVRFFQTGMSTGFNGTFTVCDGRGNARASGLIIANTGRARKAVDANGDPLPLPPCP